MELAKFPYPYQAGFTVSSDIDSASPGRFRSVHALFGGSEVIQQGSAEWRTLGLTTDCSLFDKHLDGVPGFGFKLSDSFFLVGDPTTFGMYRYENDAQRFQEEVQAGENCADLIRTWLKQGRIDTFHAFLHYTRREIEPLLAEFYQWCERENVVKPSVWTNHSWADTPSGLCPDELQPCRARRFLQVGIRAVAGPCFGRTRLSLKRVFIRYRGATPGSRYYVNDLLAANGLRYVWLNRNDLLLNRMSLPEQMQNGRATILRTVTLDDGIRYWRFDRCAGQPADAKGACYLRDSAAGFDASCLITEENLKQLCAVGGTSILTAHWTHFRSLPLTNETLERFALLQRWRDAGKIWVTSLARLLEWTRRRTFLQIACHRESGRLIVNIAGVDDPIFGFEAVSLADLHGLAFRVAATEEPVTVALRGEKLSPGQVRRAGDLYWLDTGSLLQPPS